LDDSVVVSSLGASLVLAELESEISSSIELPGIGDEGRISGHSLDNKAYAGSCCSGERGVGQD